VGIYIYKEDGALLRMHEPESKLLVLWRTTLEGGVEAKEDDQEKAYKEHLAS
jgi:hypothetical protein